MVSRISIISCNSLFFKSRSNLARRGMPKYSEPYSKANTKSRVFTFTGGKATIAEVNTSLMISGEVFHSHPNPDDMNMNSL